MGSAMAEEVCYDSPWEYTSAAARMLNGRQSESTNSIKFVPKPQLPQPPIVQPAATPVTTECTCDTRQPNSSISSNDSGISDALRQSPPSQTTASPFRQQPQTTASKQPGSSKQPRTARSVRSTTTALDGAPWTYRGPGTDDRPPEEYESPWDYKRTLQKLTKPQPQPSASHLQQEDESGGSDYYDRVPSEVDERRQAMERCQKTQSVCVVSPIGRPRSGGGGPDGQQQQQPRSASARSTDSSGGSSRASSKNETQQLETAFPASSGSVASQLRRRQQLLDSDAERRNRLIQHLAAGDTVPADLLHPSTSSSGKSSGSAGKTNRQQPPQPAIRWSKIRQTPTNSPNTSTDSNDTTTMNGNVARVAVVAPSPVKSRSVSAEQEQFAKLSAGGQKPPPPPPGKKPSPTGIGRPPLTAADCMTQSFYDQVPKASQQQQQAAAVNGPIDYDVPWEFKSKLNIERLRQGSSPRAVSAVSSQSRSTGTGSSCKSRSKTPPVQQKPHQLTNPGLVKQKSVSSIGGGTGTTGSSSSSNNISKRSTLNRNELSLNFGAASPPALNTVAEEFDVSVPLERQGWYHGNINRQDAEQRLARAHEGAYLVRLCESNKDEYALSLKSARGFMHMKIQFDRERGWILGYFSQPFQHIPPMIRYYSLNKLPIKGAEHMCLLHPLNEPLL